MFTLILFLCSLLHLTAAAANAPPCTPTEHFLLNCGTDTTTTSTEGLNWDGDSGSKFVPANTQNISTESTPSGQSSVTRVPFMTARIFQCSPFTYTFPLSPGPKFLRLYFYPATYSNLQKSISFFSVTANHYTLLKNFSAFLTVTDLKQDSVIIKEFVLQVSHQQLNVTFSPSPNSYAFINGIEIVSIPANYYALGLDNPIKNVGQTSPFFIDTDTALETFYRFNVGGNNIPGTGDTGMFRSWIQDDEYMLRGTLGFTLQREIPIRYTSDTPSYSAPEIVYTTTRNMDNNNSFWYNMTWTFPLDSGFYYLLRLYFCEIQTKVTLDNQRVFIIDINNQTAEEEADVIKWSTGNGIPVYRDYVVKVDDESINRRGKWDLWLSMRPNKFHRSVYPNAILNGMEIFKLNGSDGSLAGPNPELDTPGPPPESYKVREMYEDSETESPGLRKGKKIFKILKIVGGILSSGTAISILTCLYKKCC